MRTTPGFRLVASTLLAALLTLGLRGAPAEAECEPSRGRPGPVAPPPPPPPAEPEPEPEPPPVTPDPEPAPDPGPPPPEPTPPPPPPEPDETPVTPDPDEGKPTTPPAEPEPEPEPERPRPTTPPADPSQPPPDPRPGENPDPDNPPGRPPVTTPPSDTPRDGGPDPAPTPPQDGPTTPTPGSAPTPTPAPSGPNVPAAAAGGTRTAPNVGGRTRGRRPKGTDSLEWRWTTWWAFNRWNFLPQRNEVVRRNFARFHVVTGEGSGLKEGWADRRDRLARMRAGPALVRIMRADLRPGDLGIKAAAAMGLARVVNSAEAVESVIRAAEDEDMPHDVREAAAFACGLFRRSDTDRQMDGARVDALRTRLFALADERRTPRKVACLAVLAVGMLGDQPRSGPLPVGVAETRNLWRRLVKADRGSEVHIAYLTALGMQPGAAAGDTVLEGLRDIALGKRFAKRSWSARERSHALCTLVRLGGERWRPAMTRLMADRRISAEVRRAAFITLGERAEGYAAADRRALVRTWNLAIKQTRDPLTRGLGLIALGRIVGADVADPEGGAVLRTTEAGGTLLKYVKSSAQNLRGFAVLALALAMRDADDEERSEARFRKQAEALLQEGLRRSRGNAESLAPYVVAAGLGKLDVALPTLETLVGDANGDQRLRAFAAVACGQIGRAGPSTVHALKKAVADYRLGNLRVEAALGLAYLTGDRDAKLLREDIERRRYTHSHRIGHVAIALGQMGDLRAILPLSKLLLDEKSDHGARGAAAVALGLLCDPEIKPSLSKIWEDVNYPARSAALHEALTFY